MSDYLQRAKFFRTKKRLGQNFLVNPEVISDILDYAQISKDDIRISVKAGKKETKIYTLSELIDGVLIEDSIKALEKEEVSIRVWVSQNSTLPLGSNIHYHGILEVEDYIPEDIDVASVEGEYDGN